MSDDEVLTYDGPNELYATPEEWVRYRYRGGKAFLREGATYDGEPMPKQVLCKPAGLESGGQLKWAEYFMRYDEDGSTLHPQEDRDREVPRNIRTVDL